MQIVVAPDSFKECLTATQVSLAIFEGIKRIVPEAEIACITVADGGEGTVEALITATGGEIIPVQSVDALNRPINSFYGILGDGKTKVIEMAAASGIELLAPEERNPIELGVGSLGELFTINDSEVHPQLQKATITVACDVRNPLFGTSGATYIYGPQKGATNEILEILEKNLIHYFGILHKKLGMNVSEIPGAGAAGGLGAGLMAFCNAELVPGFELVSKLTNPEKHISQASLIFTAEGKIDSQTAFGKTISGIAQLAKKYQVPVIALAGTVTDDLTELHRQGVTSIFAIGNQPMSLEKSKARAAELLANTTSQIMRTAKEIGKF
jgi:glycerate 2-kinase